MRKTSRHFRPLDVLLLFFLAVIGVATYAEERPPKPVLPSPVIMMQEKADALVRGVFSPPVSPWVSGLLLGDDHAFSREWKEAFRRTGTSHLTAVSGYNISVLIVVLGTATSRLPLTKRMRITGGVVCIIAFVLLTGAPASVIRAAVMAGIVLLARLLGRPAKSMRVFLLGIAGMVAFRPGILMHDLGFQLSALATFGLIVFTPAIQSISSRILPRAVAEPLAQTVAATVTVSPLIASTFGTFSLITLPANLLVGAVVPVMMAMSFLLLVPGAVVPSVARVLAEVLKPVFMFPLEVIRFASGIPHAEVYGFPALASSLALSVAVLTASFLHQRRHPYVEEE